LRQAVELGIRYQSSGGNVILTGYSDADYAGDTETKRFITGYIFVITGEAVSWMSQRQSMVSLSTTEAEYVAASAASKELIWLRHLLSDIDCRCDKPVLLVDNQSNNKIN